MLQVRNIALSRHPRTPSSPDCLSIPDKIKLWAVSVSSETVERSRKHKNQAAKKKLVDNLYIIREYNSKT